MLDVLVIRRLIGCFGSEVNGVARDPSGRDVEGLERENGDEGEEGGEGEKNAHGGWRRKGKRRVIRRRFGAVQEERGSPVFLRWLVPRRA